MDRNQAIGLVLIAGILIVYSVFFRPPVEEQPIVATDTTEVASTDPGQLTTSPEPVVVQDTSAAKLTEEYGVFATGAIGSNQTLKVETDVAIYTFSNKGGQIKSVELKDFKSYNGDPLVLTSAENSAQQLIVPTVKGNIDLSELYFTTSASSTTISEEGTTQVVYTLNTTDGGSIEFVYNITANKYDLGYKVRFNGLSNSIIGDEVTLKWSKAMKRYEKNLEDARTKTTISYYTVAEDFEELKATSKDPQTETVAEPVRWASFNQKFFNAGIIAEKGFKAVTMNTAIPVTDTTIVKAGTIDAKISTADLYEGADFTYVYTPKKYRTLKKIGYDYQENVYMGYALVSWVNKLIIAPLFTFLEKHIGNYGIIIMIIVFVVKLVLFPLTRKSYLSMAKMKVLKPELDKIKEKVGDDMQKQQQEQMKLYREMGVNPLSGCLPMVLQMPILFAMFFFFPNSIELRQESFLWATDLSSYDVLFNLGFTIPFYGSHVSGFTLLMTISTLLYTWSNNQVSTVQGPMKSIGYVMPIIFMFVLNSYSAGLSFYYFVSNLVTFGQQTLIRRFVDDEKIRAKLEENKKNSGSKKKSKFQQRLEEAMKASQEAQRQKQGKGKK
ncbi:membrane protein insertase YidC [Roseivirga pacifica]|uniref:membrane protein insertase YidC n=1 Tax=Roseivirga pacifica TaxID=1267423 RepID=UPI0020960704|nr:membrane protein insertase YidC [Roseivirga pacifica]MCO6357927.1 membrane protein insertase YidC [Roseivirga pacifica]MCO6366366.1 membrane protein insertase YidC [Roseivirga pacifica]MCO6370851.1 membrane protein insertase YidC [Roseivirga pacifica]MCO6373659.1 membrane protein insertase YidC [Roseivirga pacifica]MCO6380640.1 membrane protein insertase YidC [Roseivirga pacifica]